MRRTKGIALACLVGIFPAWSAWAVQPYHAPITDILAVKNILDDPAPFYSNCGYYRAFIPEEVWNQITFDPEESRALWEKAVGFRAPEVVGQIAPEIKPGRYTLADKNSYPFEALMTPYHYKRFNPPGTAGLPNHIGYFTEFEVVETRQLWHALPVGKATIENKGKTRLDEEGYIKHKTYVSGYPFPRPSGRHKAWQIVYNLKKRVSEPESAALYDLTVGVNGKHRIDHIGKGHYYWLTAEGRVMYPPYGWFDKRAEVQGERLILLYMAFSPRDLFGNAYYATLYANPMKDVNFLAYVNFLRRIRKMSSTDSQDQAIGQDLAFDDTAGFAQPIRPDRFPYEMRVIEEREFLVPAYTFDGASYLDTKDNWKWKGLKFKRRPMWVIELEQLDKNYIYSKRVFYVDRETLLTPLQEMYDQKGRYFRTMDAEYGVVEPLGFFNGFHVSTCDWVDTHCTWSFAPAYPALWLSRKDISLHSMMMQK